MSRVEYVYARSRLSFSIPFRVLAPRLRPRPRLLGSPSLPLLFPTTTTLMLMLQVASWQFASTPLIGIAIALAGNEHNKPGHRPGSMFSASAGQWRWKCIIIIPTLQKIGDLGSLCIIYNVL